MIYCRARCNRVSAEWKKMLEKKIISPQELVQFGPAANLNEQAKTLVKQQTNNWKLAANNYFALNKVKTRTFDFGHFKILAQFNPERIRSSAAKTDTKSIAERPCFLCTENLPPEQKGILFQNKYLILINPYPIFTEHLTISSLEHIPQQILPHFTDLLDLSQNLTGFTVFYNGPKCGASAPDHFHFQAGLNGILPVEKEFTELDRQHSQILFQNKTLKIIAVENYLRHFVAITSTNKNEILEKFEFMYTKLQSATNEEPMVNILCFFENGKWRVIIFPREKQRPSHYYRNDASRILVSPAAAELGGILILPEKQNFKNITKKEIEEIYKEVTLNKHLFQNLCNALKSNL